MPKIRNQSLIVTTFPTPFGETEILRLFSNENAVENISESFRKMRTSSTQTATPNQEITFTITLDNQSEFDIFDVKIHDILPTEMVFIKGLVKIDGKPYPDFDPEISFILPTPIHRFSKIVITYLAKLAKMPQSGETESQSMITFSVDKMRDVTEFSNKICIKAVENTIEIIRTANKTVVNHNDIIKFTNIITNYGADIQNNANFSDPIPPNTQFVPNSLIINQQKYDNLDPTKSFEIPPLSTGETMIIEYEVKILWSKWNFNLKSFIAKIMNAWFLIAIN